MKEHDGYYWPDHDVDGHFYLAREQENINKAIKHVKNFDVCVQAGGNVGIWPKRLAQLFTAVYTFEPDDENFQCLLKNATERNITAFNVALSDKHENIHVKPPTPAHKSNCGAYQVFEGGKRAMCIDDLELTACDLIWLDVEGYELKALNGAIETITKYKPVLIFEDKELPIMYDKNVGDVEKWLESLDYRAVERFNKDVVCIAG